MVDRKENDKFDLRVKGLRCMFYHYQVVEFRFNTILSPVEGTGFILLVLWKLTLYTLTLECIFSILHSTHMLWQC